MTPDSKLSFHIIARAKSHSCVKIRVSDNGEPTFRALPLISSSLGVHFVVYVRNVCAGH